MTLCYYTGRPSSGHLTVPLLAAGMLDTVREMLAHDTDTMVVSNCMSVIQKVNPRPVAASA